MTATSPQAIDLRACDREPIHLPGLIQPQGFLLVLDPQTWRVVQASVNVESFVHRPIERVLGLALTELFPAPQAAALVAGLQDPGLEKNPQMLGSFSAGEWGERGADVLYAIGHRIDGVPILELEVTPAPRDARRAVAFAELYPLVQTFIAQLQTAGTMERLCELASKEVRRITGFDRVLVYRFDKDLHGTVVAEDRNDVLPSYLDLRFPASDIPAQARELYRVNRLRLIADADYEPVPVEPAAHPQTGKPLDMSFCVLRSVSPVHCCRRCSRCRSGRGSTSTTTPGGSRSRGSRRGCCRGWRAKSTSPTASPGSPTTCCGSPAPRARRSSRTARSG